MPTIPLYTPSAEFAQSHHVIAPGGYEYWCIAIRDQSSGVCLVATRMQGSIFDSRYLEATRKFLRNPTSTVPPLPADYPGARLEMIRTSDRRESLLPPDALVLNRGIDGTLELQISADFLRGSVRVILGNASQAPSYLSVYPQSKGQHSQALADGLTARGQLMLNEKPLEFEGNGSVKCGFGTAPAADELMQEFTSAAAGLPARR